MGIKVCKNKNNVSVFFLILIMLFNISCFKRVSIPPETLKKGKEQRKIYLHLKSETENKNSSFLLVRNPHIEGEYLLGESDKKKVRIPLENIKSIEVVKVDKAKLIITSSAFILLTFIGYAFASAAGSASVD